MTTANLSVGINTGPALASLEALKIELKKVANSDYRVNAGLLVDAVQRSLDSHRFLVRVTADGLGDFKRDTRSALVQVARDTRRGLTSELAHTAKAFKDAVGGATKGGIPIELGDVTIKSATLSEGALAKLQAIPAKVDVDGQHLFGQVYQTVNNAFGAAVSGSGAQIAAAVKAAVLLGLGDVISPAAVAAANRGSDTAVDKDVDVRRGVGASDLAMAPVLAQLSQAVGLLNGHLGDLATPGAPRASRAKQTTAEVAEAAAAGAVKASRGMSAVEPGTGARISTRESIDASKATADIAAFNKAKRESQTSQSLLDQRLREIGQKERLLQQSASNIDAQTLLGLPSRDSMKSMGAQIAAQMRDGVKTEAQRAKSASRVDAQTLLGLPSRDSTKSMGAQIAAQMRDGVKTEALRAKSASGIDPNTLLGLPSRGSMKSMGAQIASQMRSAVADEALNTKFQRPDAKNDLARAQSQLSKAQNAQALIARGLEAEALRKYGSDAVRAAGNLDQLRGSVDRLTGAGGKATASMQGYNESMRQGHSLARGLAGSLGAMWLTWGSTIPLVAGAALGATLRSVFSTGKELEYQLAFVAVLTDNASISFDRFANSVRGSMIAPTEAAAAMRGLAQNGLDAGQAFLALPKILELATAGEMELMDAALGATGVMVAFNLQVDDLGRVGDVFAKAAAMSNTSVSSMVESMRQASTVGDSYNVTLEQTAAALATLAKRNIMGTAAGTAFRNMMTELAAPSRKAAQAMKQVRFEVFDATEKLKPLPQLLEELAQKTAMMNEKSKLAFLGDIFDERGAKAIGALLSDLDVFNKTYKELTEGAQGFGRSVIDALGETTQGKVKKLMSEFQLSTTDAFNKSADSVRGFVDELRLIVGSDQFKQWVFGLTDAVVNFTRYIVDNAAAIKHLVVGFVSLKLAVMGLSIIASVGTALGTLRASITALTATAVVGTAGLKAFGAAAISVGSALTGGLALIGYVVAQWWMLKDATTEATRATEAKANSTQLMLENLQREGKSLAERIAQLREENRLMYEGADAAKAKDTATQNLNRTALLQQKSNLDTAIRQTSINIEQAGSKGGPRRLKTGSTSEYVSNVPQELLDQLANQKQARDNVVKALEEVDNNTKLGPVASQLSEFNKLLGRAQKLNADAEYLRRSKVSVADLLLPNRDDVEKNPGALEAFRKQVEDYAAFIDSLRTQQYRPIKPGAGNPDRVELTSLKARNAREEDELRSRLEYQKKLDDLKFGSNKYSPYLRFLMSEQREQSAITESLNLQEKVLQRLKSLRSTLVAKDPSDTLIKDVDKEIANQEYSLNQFGVDQRRNTTLSRVRAGNESLQSKEEFDALLSRLGSEDVQQRDGIRIKPLGGTDPIKAAGQAAQMATMNRYRSEAVKLESQILAQQERLPSLNEEQAALQLQLIQQDQSRLAILNAQASAQSEISAKLAQDTETYRRSAEYGFEKFWADYASSALTSAKIVEDGMKRVTSSMEESLTNFLMTGTFGWKSFARSMLNEAIRVMSHRAVSQMLGAGMSMFSGWRADSMFSSAADAALSSSGNMWLSSYHGNVMTSAGPVPLHRYAAGGVGGVTRKRMFSEFGEGSTAEAYVPLPDGRTIPVTMRGGAGGDQVNQEFNIHITVQGGQTNAETGQVVSRAVVDTLRNIARGEIVTAQRPGGALYKA